MTSTGLNLLIASPRAVVPAHFDMHHNFLLQIEGTKEVMIGSYSDPTVGAAGDRSLLRRAQQQRAVPARRRLDLPSRARRRPLHPAVRIPLGPRRPGSLGHHVLRVSNPSDGTDERRARLQRTAPTSRLPSLGAGPIHVPGSGQARGVRLGQTCTSNRCVRDATRPALDATASRRRIVTASGAPRQVPRTPAPRSPGQALLVACARPAAVAAASPEIAALAGALDTQWPATLMLARWQGIAPRLARSLVVSGVAATVPHHVGEELQAAYLRTMARNLVLRRELARVVDELGRHHIDVLLLKGAALVPEVHHDPGVRPMDDLDLLVHREDLTLADQVIRDLGYVASASAPVALAHPSSDPDASLPHHLAALVREDGNVTIELHHKLGDSCSPLDFDVAGLWDRAVPCTVGERTCLRPSNEDLLAHVCLHFLVDRVRLFSRRALAQLADIAAILDTFADALEWATLTSEAITRGYSRSSRSRWAPRLPSSTHRCPMRRARRSHRIRSTHPMPPSSSLAACSATHPGRRSNSSPHANRRFATSSPRIPGAGSPASRRAVHPSGSSTATRVGPTRRHGYSSDQVRLLPSGASPPSSNTSCSRTGFPTAPDLAPRRRCRRRSHSSKRVASSSPSPTAAGSSPTCGRVPTRRRRDGSPSTRGSSPARRPADCRARAAASRSPWRLGP